MTQVQHPDPSWPYKGWPSAQDSVDLDELASSGLNLFRDDFLFPVATISASALEHNIATVADFCHRSGLSLAPHAKTTMSPEIIQRQLSAGAWGITAATANQAQTFRRFGVERILIAHQVVDPAAVRWIATELRNHPEAEIICLVDSIAAVERMDHACNELSTRTRIGVLVELGFPNGRTGCRTIAEALTVAEACAKSEHLELRGVEGYEGIVPTSGDDLTPVDEFLRDLADLAKAADDRGLFNDLDEIIVTAGGSMFPDRVAAVLGQGLSMPRPSRVVIRSGCYVTHDSGMYEHGAPFGIREPMDADPALQAALKIWSYVVSRPQPDLAVLGFGKRDASYDVDLPRPLEIHSEEGVRTTEGKLVIYALNDQHAYVRLPPEFPLSVGDIVACGISHPCTTFDKWRAFPLIDDDFDVVGVIRTFF